MANITRFGPFNELVDDIFKGFLVRPMVYEGAQFRAAAAEEGRGDPQADRDPLTT